MHPSTDVARYVHVTDEFESVTRAWRRLGFEPVSGWSRGIRSTLFRAGPSFVELVDGVALKAAADASPAYAAAVAVSGR